MAMPTTAVEWLPVLTRRLDDRRPRIDRLRSYTNGNAPLPEAGQNVKAAWVAFQRKARTNFGALAIDALAERLICNGITVGSAATDDDAARRIWRDNRMDVAVSDTIRDMLTVSIGYMVVGKDGSGRPVVTSEQPEFMYAATDPLRTWQARAAVKVWRDEDLEADFAYVWVEGGRQKFQRSIWSNATAKKKLITKASGGWSPLGDLEPFDGPVPIVVFENHDSMGEFEAHTDILDRISKATLDLLVLVANQAFRQRFISGDLAKVDENNKPIDYSVVFPPSAGGLWILPDGVELKESQESAQSIQGVLSTIKDAIRDFAAVLRTPLAMLSPDGQNQSATGAEFAKEGLVMKAKDRIARIKPALNEVLTFALRVENPAFDEVVSVGFADPTHVSTAERYDAAVKAKAAGVPHRTIMIDILGFSADQVDSMDIELAEQELTAALEVPVGNA